MERVKKNIHYLLPILLTVCFFFVPFFWFEPGQIDWGGDSTRAYYFQPYDYLVNHSLFGISPSDVGGPVLGYYTIPYTLTLYLLSYVFKSPTLLVSFFHGLKLGIAFLSIYIIVWQLISDNGRIKKSFAVMSSVIGGVLYVLSPVAIVGWDKTILTHDQLFLNPLIFLLLFIFLKTNKFIYIIGAILVTFIFSHNFSFGAAPPLFSFYPLGMLFLVIYNLKIKKRRIVWKKVILGFLLFLGVHAFDFIPLILSLFKPGSDLYSNVFTEQGKYDRGLSYFLAISQSIKVSHGIYLAPQQTMDNWYSYYTLCLPFLITITLLFKKTKYFLLLVTFLLIALFFTVANITSFGVYVYQLMFNLPGFSMFRNFYGQWQYSYMFYYAIVSSVAFYYIFRFIQKKVIYFLGFTFLAFALISGNYLLSGDTINKEVWLSNDVKLLDIPDPQFIEAINFLKNSDIAANVLVLPFSDPAYQIIAGSQRNGVYQGPALIAYLAGKRDFAGPVSFGLFTEELNEAVRMEDYGKVGKILALYNIKYIFYNSDPLIYEQGFPKFPYDYVRDIYPKTQSGYSEFLAKLKLEKIISFGKYYHIYQIPDDDYLPRIYVPSQVISSNDPSWSFTLSSSPEARIAFAQNNKNSKVGHVQKVYEAVNSNPFDALYLNNHLHNHQPFLSRRPDSILYPLVLLREQFELANKNGFEEFVDYSLFLLSKRFLELTEWGDEMEINADESMIKAGGYYFNWETNIQRYIAQTIKLTGYVQSSDEDTAAKNYNLVKINEQLRRHEASLVEYVSKMQRPKEEKQRLINLVGATYKKIYGKLTIPVFSSEKNYYFVDLPQEEQGQFRINIENIPPLDHNRSNAILAFNNKQYELKGDSGNDPFIKFPNIPTTKGKFAFTMDYSRRNYMAESELFHGKEFIAAQLNKRNHEEKLAEYRGERQYLLTFEYMTSGANFAYKFLDTKTGEAPTNRNIFFRKNLNSEKWTVEQLIITADPYATAGYIQFENNYSTPASKLKIRNLTLNETATPRIVFVKNEHHPLTTPSISFQMINPTMYKVTVENSNAPFYLVLSSAFDENWRIKLANDEHKPGSFRSYFNNDIKEYPAKRNIDLNEIFQLLSSKEIASSMHLVTNGYANGWYIDPEEVGKRAKYTLIIYYQGQHLFYIGSLVTILFLIVTVVLAIYLTLPHKK